MNAWGDKPGIVKLATRFQLRAEQHILSEFTESDEVRAVHGRAIETYYCIERFS